MKYTLIVSGGTIDPEFGARICRQTRFDQIIGVDRGLEFLYDHKISPTDIVGDFDSISDNLLPWYRDHTDAVIRAYQPEKDLTDTEIAMRLALECGTDEITILGATGTRIDHMIGNLQLLRLALREGVRAVITDPCNHIELLDRPVQIRRADCHGAYVSLLPMTETVRGITLTGFKYPLYDYTMTSDNSIGISNELTAETGMIELKEGILIKIESADL